MSFFLTRIGDGPFTDFHNAIAGSKADSNCCEDQVHVRPLEPVPVDIVGDLAKENAFLFEDTIGLLEECGIDMRKIIFLFRAGFLC